jgi:glycosyltransferase involved in cell wall biosynthesis
VVAGDRVAQPPPRTGGPATFVNVDPDAPVGWLVPPDDEDALVEALVEALIDPGDRLARGRAARAFAQRCFSWPRVAAAVAQIYASPRVR